MTIYLVRHPPVVKAWLGKCYGQSDIGLSRAGLKIAADLAHLLADLGPDLIIHSGLKRTKIAAQRLAAKAQHKCLVDASWQERDFGTWEGQSWSAIYKQTGNAMDGMLNDPDHFRPGGGETTAELLHRCVAAYHALPSNKTIVVISHGGPIACVRLHLAAAPISRLAEYIPATGEIIQLS